MQPNWYSSCQRKYTLEILSEAGLFDAQPASIPMESNHQLAKTLGPSFALPNCYH